MKLLKTVIVATTTGLLLTTAHAQTWITNGLVAYYQFNGNADDSSGNGHNGSFIGPQSAFVSDRFGQVSKACYLTNGEFVDIGNIFANVQTNYSQSCWVKSSQALKTSSDNAGPYRNIIFMTHRTSYSNVGNAVTCGWGTLGVNSYGNISVMVDDDFYLNYCSSTNFNVLDGKWHQIVGITTNQSYLLFADGVLIAQLTDAHVMSPINSAMHFWLGRHYWNYGWTTVADDFDGVIDDVRIYNRALSSNEVAQLYASESFCSPHRAQAIATLSGDGVAGAAMTDSGCGYTNTPSVRIVGGGGSGATAVANMTNGIITDVVITSAGSGYTNAPRILIESPPFVPMVSIAVSKVKVTQQVRVNHNYVLEASSGLSIWTPTGPAFTAEAESVVNEFDVDTVGRFFRLREVP